MDLPETAVNIDGTKIVDLCQNSKVGKLLPSALYVHIKAIAAIDPILQKYERRARSAKIDLQTATIVKFSFDGAKISYLCYPEFDRDPHPALKHSIIIDLNTLEAKKWDYTNTNNPPILHRKETFVTPDYPSYQEFAELTKNEVALGLLDDARFIGNRNEWEYRLKRRGISFEGHRLICPIDPQKNNKIDIRIERHKAAIVRKELSRPVRLAKEAGLFTAGITFFDYGCGYGGDVERIAKQGYQSSGWDPYYFPDNPLNNADLVNIGYVINVIEDLQERQKALQQAWELADRILVIAAQVLIDDRHRGIVVYGDGIITSRNTFQKYYHQEELKIYIDRVLNVDSIPAGLGIYFAFKDEAIAQNYRVSRFHSRESTPRVKSQGKKFEEYREILTPLMDFMTKRGRLPVKQELATEAAIKAEFGGFRRAFKVVLQVTDEKEWEAIAEKRRSEIILYLALSTFDSRPTVRKLPSVMKEDIKALFGNYKTASDLADEMLFDVGDLDKIAELSQKSAIGKIIKNSLLVHVSALEKLDPLLRLYEGCASRAIGRLEDANVIKINFKKPKISYLYYPEFDSEPHPILYTSMTIDLGDLQVKYRDYDLEDNPPILHQKDALITPEYPNYEKFAKLTRQETERGLLDNIHEITRLKGWCDRLADRCATIKNYRVYWRKDCDPYKLKCLKSQYNSRKRKEINTN